MLKSRPAIAWNAGGRPHCTLCQRVPGSRDKWPRLYPCLLPQPGETLPTLNALDIASQPDCTLVLRLCVPPSEYSSPSLGPRAPRYAKPPTVQMRVGLVARPRLGAGAVRQVRGSRGARPAGLGSGAGRPRPQLVAQGPWRPRGGRRGACSRPPVAEAASNYVEPQGFNAVSSEQYRRYQTGFAKEDGELRRWGRHDATTWPCGRRVCLLASCRAAAAPRAARAPTQQPCAAAGCSAASTRPATRPRSRGSGGSCSTPPCAACRSM